MERVEIPAQASGADKEIATPQVPQGPQGEVSNEPQTQAHETNVQSSGDRPQWLPEKFQSPEDMAKAYSELEKKLGAPKEEQATQQEAEAQPLPTQENPEEQKAFQAWETKFTDFSKEFSEKGKLSDQSYLKLTQMGYPKAVVDAYINGQIALASQGTQSLLAELGGERGFKEMHDWASENLSQEEIDSYNAILDSGDERQAGYAVKGMHARFKNSAPKQPKLIGGTQGQSSGASYRSVGELTRAMSDPRYKNDSAYRKDVERKLAHSNIL